MSGFSDYIVYLDESGSPNLEGDRADFPIFVLTSICIKKDIYINEVVPALQSLKFKYFGHDQTILHEREIRRKSGAFAFLQTDAKLRTEFLTDISQLIENQNFEILACVIDKKTLRKNYHNPFDPYKLALLFSMEQIALRLENLNQCGKTIHVIAESRGKTEDKELELEFRRIADGSTVLPLNQPKLLREFDWQILFSNKKSNSAGLQLADLVARPIGIHILRPKQDNKAYKIIEKKNPSIIHFP